jgi:hypothetical protein
MKRSTVSTRMSTRKRSAENCYATQMHISNRLLPLQLQPPLACNQRSVPRLPNKKQNYSEQRLLRPCPTWKWFVSIVQQRFIPDKDAHVVPPASRKHPNSHVYSAKSCMQTGELFHDRGSVQLVPVCSSPRLQRNSKDACTHVHTCT